MHKIVKASVAIRALAAVIDFLIAVFFGLGIFALVRIGFVSNDYTKGVKQSILDESVSSRLYTLDDNGNAVAYEGSLAHSSYEFYQGIIYDYYVDYLPERLGVSYDAYWYNVHILGMNDVRGRYPSLSLDYPSSEGSQYWHYDGTNYDTLAIPLDSYYVNSDPTQGLSESGAASLLSFYHQENSNQADAYYNAVSHFFNQSFMISLRSAYTLMDLTYPLVIAVPLTCLIFYLAIPLLFNNGETLGKKIFHLCLVNQLGFSVSKGQVVMRQLPSIILITVPFIFLSPIQSGAIILGILGVSYACVLFTKDQKALHDMWGGTLVVDAKESLFYENLDAQNQGEAEYQELMKETEAVIVEGKEEIEAEKDIRNSSK